MVYFKAKFQSVYIWTKKYSPNPRKLTKANILADSTGLVCWQAISEVVHVVYVCALLFPHDTYDMSSGH